MTVTEERVAYFRHRVVRKVTLELEPLKDKMSLSSGKLGKEQASQKSRGLETRETAGGPEPGGGWVAGVLWEWTSSKWELAREVGRSQVISLVHMGRRSLKFIARALGQVSRRGSVMGWFSVLNAENGLVNGKVIGGSPVRRLSP